MTAHVVHNAAGGYRFLGQEGRPYANGALADHGLDIVHATFEHPVPLSDGIAAAQRHVAEAGRPVQSLAGFELRIPRPFTQHGFEEFNRGYIALLRGIGLEVEGLMPAARTNVAPVLGTVAEPSVFAFTYTALGSRGRPAFVLSGATEEIQGNDRALLKNIAEILTARATVLGCELVDATAAQLYASGPLDPEDLAGVAAQLGDAVLHGVHWFPSLPPIEGLRLEIDVRSAGTELSLPV